MNTSGVALEPHKTKTSFPARYYLAVLMIAVAAPTLLVTGYLLTRYATAEKSRLEERVREDARVILNALDRRFSSLIEAAEVLAATQDFEPEDLEEFHKRAGLARKILGRNIVLRDLEGRQVVNPSVPWGQSLPRADRPIDKLVIATGKPQISDVFVSLVGGDSIVSVVVPILREGKPVYLLHVVQDISYFQALIDEVRVRPEHVALIMDGNNLVVARSRDSQRFAGKPGLIVGPDPEGSHISTNLEGRPSLTGWATSDISGWKATASVDYDVIDAPRRQALITVAAVSAFAILLGFALAWVASARLSRSLRVLTAAGAALGARAPVPEVETPLTEANEVGRELRQAETRLAENEARLEKALVAAKMYSFEYNTLDGDITRSASAAAVLGDDDPALRRGPRAYMCDRIHPADRERFIRTVQSRTAEMGEYSVQFRYTRPSGEIAWLQVNGVCQPDPSGRGVRVTGFARDITTRKQSQIRQALLVRELHHRVKNNLATVLALANLSARNATSVQDYQNKLRARIQSMARSHSLLNENSFRHGFLRTLIMEELEPYIQGEQDRVKIDGKDIELPPEAALALGMAMHELATNAGKYGALSNESGSIQVSWREIEPDAADGVTRLHIEWRESGGPPVIPPSRKGFGSRLLESVIGEQLKGHVELRYEPDGLVAIIEARLDELPPRDETVGASS